MAVWLCSIDNYNKHRSAYYRVKCSILQTDSAKHFAFTVSKGHPLLPFAPETWC